MTGGRGKDFYFPVQNLASVTAMLIMRQWSLAAQESRALRWEGACPDFIAEDTETQLDRQGTVCMASLVSYVTSLWQMRRDETKQPWIPASWPSVPSPTVII